MSLIDKRKPKPLPMCPIPNCGKPRSPKSKYCDMHYARIRRHGDPHYIGWVTRMTPEQKRVAFEPNVYRTWNCWFWIGVVQNPTKSVGYGFFGSFYAHRVAYELYKGPIPEGLQVLHSCDNPRCVNPEHLFLGTATDNMADKTAKGIQSGLGWRTMQCR